jgi:hypothetical protein
MRFDAAASRRICSISAADSGAKPEGSSLNCAW